MSYTRTITLFVIFLFLTNDLSSQLISNNIHAYAELGLSATLHSEPSFSTKNLYSSVTPGINSKFEVEYHGDAKIGVAFNVRLYLNYGSFKDYRRDIQVFSSPNPSFLTTGYILGDYNFRTFSYALGPNFKYKIDEKNKLHLGFMIEEDIRGASIYAATSYRTHFINNDNELEELAEVNISNPFEAKDNINNLTASIITGYEKALSSRTSLLTEAVIPISSADIIKYRLQFSLRWMLK